MARPEKKLDAVHVRQSPAGKYNDGGGLWLVKTGKASGKWVLRVVAHGRRREMGLGSITDVGLKQARDEAEKWRAVARQGVNPILERERQRRERERNSHLLKDVTREAFEARKAELKGEGKAGRWLTPLELHVLPRLGKTPVAEIDQIAIRDTIKPIWHDKADTARKALNRLNIVIEYAAASGLAVDMQAVSKARLLLGKSRHKTANIPSMPWQAVPDFYKSLSDGSPTHLALRMLILTGVRSAPLRHVREDQISRETIDGHEINIWTVPAEMQKGREGKTEAFRVPISSEAMSVIEKARRIARDGYLFPSAREGVISDMTLGMFMRRAELEARPHGFRSSLRVWLAECTDAPHEVAETVLQHVTGNRVTRAYQRSDFLIQRATLMERWAEHCAGRSGKLIRLAGAAS
jgi:integrase